MKRTGPTAPSERRPLLRAALALTAAFALPFAAPVPAPAGEVAAIEGFVRLPAPAGGALSAARYQNVASGAVATSPSPAAVVYLEGAFARPPRTNEVAIMAQEGYQFSSSVLPVQKGAAIAFPNRDDAYHNVFSYSKPKRFDLGRYRKDEQAPVLTFDTPGVVKLFCEIHAHMRGTILVLETPHFTTTGADGTYRLDDLPAGSYTLKAWLNESTVLERAVDLRAGETLRVDFTGP